MEEILMSHPCRAVALDGQPEVTLRSVSFMSPFLFPQETPVSAKVAVALI